MMTAGLLQAPAPLTLRARTRTHTSLPRVRPVNWMLRQNGRPLAHLAPRTKPEATVNSLVFRATLRPLSGMGAVTSWRKMRCVAGATIALLGCLSLPCRGSAAIVEFSIDQTPIEDGVGTCVYGPTKIEQVFFDRLSEMGQTTLQEKPGAEAVEHEFKLAGHEGEFVSWLGVVREIKPKADGMEGILLVQNTYFSGVSDCHIQTVEINGAGDFQIAVDQLPKDLLPLVLVRVYGTVVGTRDGLPTVQADYLRVWHWFQFNFMDYGDDRGNPKWRTAMRLPPDESIYHIGVSGRYFDERLGPTVAQWNLLRAFYADDPVLGFWDRSQTEASTAYRPSRWEAEYLEGLPIHQRLAMEALISEPRFDLDGRVRRCQLVWHRARSRSPFGATWREPSPREQIL